MTEPTEPTGLTEINASPRPESGDLTGKRVIVIGGGLAGCEVALQLARAGVSVELLEMKPLKRTPAQHSDQLAELVCSNSFRSDDIHNAIGLLKWEMRRLGSAIMEAADAAGIYIPRLCALDGLHPYGACRICTVMVNGRPQAACTQPIAQGMMVQNETEAVFWWRKAAGLGLPGAMYNLGVALELGRGASQDWDAAVRR